MKPNVYYCNQDSRFWASVKMISESQGYSMRRKDSTGDPKMKIYDKSDIQKTLDRLEIPANYLIENGKLTVEGELVLKYLNFRSDLIENTIQHFLMDREEARLLYEEILHQNPNTRLKVQMNKQKHDKRHPSYLVNIVNLLTESVVGQGNFNDNPMNMALITDDVGPLKMLCRRMDGAYPDLREPKVLWEIKEYYGTTTFGSRIADAVYETMLVGEELETLRKEYNINIKNVLFVDDRFTWWSLGRSYLCRLIDALHTYQLDYIFFGKEVVIEWPNTLKDIIATTK